ncbi:helix-turn-helix domain-containing protein [Acinetobacter sp.]|uniref:helix-turn-helix domain-containing protein n=1 Tax=Acinetobacter sp. TaxID=472 RepID=UPI0028307C94|nr:helix-turn-helix domain-containing protein [Acinetobacter sp.]MDR0235322.1 AraC family transcriptional regulator [Acinetobacter sp.]
MKSFLKTKSVNVSLMVLLNDFCKKKGLNFSSDFQNTLNSHITFGEWLKKIKIIYKQYPCEGLGLEIGALVQPHHIGITAYIAQFGDTLESYMSVFSKYEKLWFNYTPKKIQIEDEFLSISWEKPAYTQAGLYFHETMITEELLVSILYHHLKQLVQSEDDIFYSLELAIPEPNDAEKYTQLFKCSVQFNCKQTKICLSRSLLSNRLKCYDPNLLGILSNYADTLLNEMPKQDSLRELINLSIIQALESNDVKIQTVAKFLNTSPRLLQIDLKNNGLSFRNILNNIRQTLAKKHLKNNKLLVIEIAFLLGYKDQTSFNRAFKIWTGLSPTDWRKKYMNQEYEPY